MLPFLDVEEKHLLNCTAKILTRNRLTSAEATKMVDARFRNAFVWHVEDVIVEGVGDERAWSETNERRK